MLANYHRLKSGVIKQVEIIPFEYNKKYIQDTYDTYGDGRIQMAWLRIGHILGNIGGFDTLLDVGYGNGDFLKAAVKVAQCYGYEINGYEIPEGCTFADDWQEQDVDVMTFFDVLEHIPDLAFMRHLRAKYVVISVPDCLYHSDEWFENWKHRKPNEHLWHFNEDSLTRFMEENGYICMELNNVEDCIRIHHEKNILTGIFKKLTI